MIERERIIEGLRAQIDSGQHIIGVSVGSGFAVRCLVSAGVHFLLALSAGRFRQVGLPSIAGLLPFANSNEMTYQFACREIVPMAHDTPVVFGLNATDPTIDLEEYIDSIAASGFSGINNYPTVGIIDGRFGQALREQGICYEREVEAISVAHAKNMFTIAFVFTPEQALDMLNAGADVICVHMGLTGGGLSGAKKVISLEASVNIANKIYSVCNETRPDAIKMVYGGPIREPVDVTYIYDRSDCMGYIGGSSFERIPSENAIIGMAKKFVQAGVLEQDAPLQGRLSDIKSHYDYVNNLKNYISENYMKDVLFSALAESAHMSRSYLSYLFKKEVGCTFQDYLANYRIEKAKKIILSESVRLAEVAAMTGFNDYAHFSKLFKKKTGVSPVEYRKAQKSK